ncbi:MAG: hypothetical protein ACKVZ6_04430 [Kineosporiaceae bacterium]
MSPRPRDGAERLLVIATVGLPAHRCEWGAAMRAELASIDGSEARRRFARSAARAVVGQCLGVRLGCGLVTGVLVAAVVVTASRLQLADGGPGVLDATVPVPAFLLMLVALVSAGLTRSFRVGLETGVYALVAGFAGLFAVLAAEGLAWMDRRGVFVLDGDPPRGVVDTADVVFNIFSTGMWAGHVIWWVPGVLIGGALGAAIGRRRGVPGVR